MGGKKSLGENRNRGHLHHRYTGHAGKRGGYGHGVARGGNVDDILSDGTLGGPVPISQEFSLFSQFDVSDRFRQMKSESEEKHSISQFDPIVTAEDGGKSDQTARLDALEDQLISIGNSLAYLEQSFYSAMNHLFYMGYTNGMTPLSPFPHMSAYPLHTSAMNDDTMKKLGDRLKTVEGRQNVIQSKIAQLDLLYGSTPSAWAKNIKKIVHENESTPAVAVAVASSSSNISNTIETQRADSRICSVDGTCSMTDSITDTDR
jgi:hypothetical protein